MAKRLRLVKIDKHQKMIWETPGGIGLFIILCVMMLMLVFWMPQLMRAFGRLAEEPPQKQPLAPEETQAKGPSARPHAAPKPQVALPPDEDKALLASVKDQEPLEKKPYFYLLAKVNAMTFNQINAAVDPTITYDTFATPAGPEKARGKVVSFEGLLLRLKEVPITDNLASGFDCVWEGYTMDKFRRVAGFVLTQAPPAVFFAPRRNVVVLKGVYLKNIVYKDQEGSLQAVPFIIAKELVQIVVPQSPTWTERLRSLLWEKGAWSRYGGYVITVLIGAAIIGLLLLEYRRRIRAAVAAHARRRPSGPLEVVPDDEHGPEAGEEEETTQHVNPGPGKEPPSPKAEEGKKAEG